jgi:dipeptidyl aminopeptidase/acylaminoacyl peptidase
MDGEGYLPEERWHLWVIDAESGEGTQITGGDKFDEKFPRWSPDGERLVFLSNHADDPDLNPDEIDIFVIPAEGGEARVLETPVGVKQLPVFSPDGAWIAYLGREGRGDWWKNTSLWVVPADGSGEAQNLTGKFDFESTNATINDLPGHLPLSPPMWGKDSEKIFFHVAQHGNSGLKSIARDGAEDSLETVIREEGVSGAYCFDQDQARLAYLHADLQTPGDLWVLDLAEDASQQLTALNRPLLEELDLGEVEEIWFKGADDNDLQGWILKPPQFDESKQYPSILEIHGGPRAQYGNYFMHEFYYLAAQGYVVYFCNPRGGRGYGEEHSRAIWNSWGTVDYDDLMVWVDIVEEKPYLDPTRMGVTGGSYGGYMTVWIIGHTNRFEAAVTQRCVSNLLSFYGSSDMGWMFEQEFGNLPPWEAEEVYWRQSPIRAIGNATTPTLVVHSENDLRCPIEQGEQVFVSLKKLGVDTEMVRFPDEPHGLSRAGRTDRRINRLEHIKRWFDRYLKE